MAIEREAPRSITERNGAIHSSSILRPACLYGLIDDSSIMIPRLFPGLRSTWLYSYALFTRYIWIFHEDVFTQFDIYQDDYRYDITPSLVMSPRCEGRSVAWGVIWIRGLNWTWLGCVADTHQYWDGVALDATAGCRATETQGAAQNSSATVQSKVVGGS